MLLHSTFKNTRFCNFGKIALNLSYVNIATISNQNRTRHNRIAPKTCPNRPANTCTRPTLTCSHVQGWKLFVCSRCSLTVYRWHICTCNCAQTCRDNISMSNFVSVCAPPSKHIRKTTAEICFATNEILQCQLIGSCKNTFKLLSTLNLGFRYAFLGNTWEKTHRHDKLSPGPVQTSSMGTLSCSDSFAAMFFCDTCNEVRKIGARFGCLRNTCLLCAPVVCSIANGTRVHSCIVSCLHTLLLAMEWQQLYLKDCQGWQPEKVTC